jgi:hypothetical protein
MEQTQGTFYNSYSWDLCYVTAQIDEQGLCTSDELQQSSISASHKQGQRQAIDVLFVCLSCSV